MSKFRRIKTEFRNQDALRKALADVCKTRGITFEEGQGNGLNLYGYQGDKRAETVQFAIRRQFVGHLSNDVGFAVKPGGSFEAIVSEFDSSGGPHARGLGLVNEITTRYNYHNVFSLAWAQGYSVTETLNAKGETELQLVKAF